MVNNWTSLATLLLKLWISSMVSLPPKYIPFYLFLEFHTKKYSTTKSNFNVFNYLLKQSALETKYFCVYALFNVMFRYVKIFWNDKNSKTTFERLIFLDYRVALLLEKVKPEVQDSISLINICASISLYLWTNCLYGPYTALPRSLHSFSVQEDKYGSRSDRKSFVFWIRFDR